MTPGEPSPEQETGDLHFQSSEDPVDEAGLRESMTGLARLASGRLDLRDTLTRVAEFAVRAIPGADGAGLILIEDDRADVVVASAPFVREIDDIQYGIGEGPCISAAREARTMRSGSLGADQRWPTFGSRVARLRVHSVLSLPLVTPDRVVGAMNVYAHGKHAFDDHAVELGELFADPAAIAAQSARVLNDAKRLAASLRAALEQRVVIDRAIGIIMSRTGIERGRSVSPAPDAESARASQAARARRGTGRRGRPSGQATRPGMSRSEPRRSCWRRSGRAYTEAAGRGWVPDPTRI